MTRDFRPEEAVVSEMVKAWVGQVQGRRSGVRFGKCSKSVRHARENVCLPPINI